MKVEKPKTNSNKDKEKYKAAFSIDGKADTFFLTNGPEENMNYDPGTWTGNLIDSKTKMYLVSKVYI